MKKNISVNLQGMIFHVEEDGYEILRQYLASVKEYFSTYEGHEEIVADIESRIAEIFYAHLNPGKQVITMLDVQALMNQMGTVSDFEMVEPEEEETRSGKAQTDNMPPPPHQEQRRLYRDINRKVLAGVSAGVANYLQVDPLWIRLAFILLVLGVPFTGGFTLLGVILYAVFWVALPVNEALPEIPVRKLFRDPVDKKLGGVASGIAIYFGADVAIIRLVFLGLAFFGVGLLTYIVLWIAVPEAKSITERVQMQGNPVTLSSIEESVKNSLNMLDSDGQESAFAKLLLLPVRLVAQVIQGLSGLLRPLLIFLGRALRMVAGLFLMLFSGSLIITLLITLGAGLGMFPHSDIIQMGDFPVSTLANTIPAWLLWAGFFTAFIPLAFLFLTGLGLLAKRFLLRPSVGWSMLGIWLLAVVALVSGIVSTAGHFQESGEYATEQTFSTAAYNTVLLDARDRNQKYSNRLNLMIEGYAGADVKVTQKYRAEGLDEEDAILNAKMISYKVEQNDSSIRFDNDITFSKNAAFRDQRLTVKILVPEGQKIRFTPQFASQLGRRVTKGEYSAEDLSGNIWQMKEGRLLCLTCSEVDSSGQQPVAGAVAAAGIDQELALLDDNYAGISKIYKVQEFSEIEAGGAYHLRIKQSLRHYVRVTGSEEEMEHLQLRVQNGVLKIKQDRTFFELWKDRQNPVLIEIETPDLSLVDLGGATQVEISGFTSDNFTVNQSGASQVALNISAGTLDVDLSGASNIKIKGTAESLAIDGSGAAKIDASRIVAQRAKVDLSGASAGTVNVQQNLQAEASGASSLKYSGDVTEVSQQKSGGASIKRQD